MPFTEAELQARKEYQKAYFQRHKVRLQEYREQHPRSKEKHNEYTRRYTMKRRRTFDGKKYYRVISDLK